MRSFQLMAVALLVLVTSAANVSAEISGEYLEARTCDVYTGPCFANAQMGLAGKEAVMAWKVDEGDWKGVSLNGLGAALVVKAEGTLGYDGTFPMQAGKTRSVILVDEKATKRQQEALVDFVKASAKSIVGTVALVKKAPIRLKNNHLDGRGTFSAGKLARIETRALRENDCVCTNEIVYYLPLTDVDNYSPAYSKTLKYQGKGLNSKFNAKRIRSAFLATFRR